MTYTSENFFEATAANFERCGRPDRDADYVSASGSAYWYDEGGVIRESDHWGFGISTCDWTIDGGAYGRGMHVKQGGKFIDGYDYSIVEDEPICGRCEFADFTWVGTETFEKMWASMMAKAA